MIYRVLIIGGYGNFGQFISKTLSQEADLKIIVAGRSIEKAQKCVAELNGVNQAEAAFIDINDDADAVLNQIKPHIVIHTSGPFQTQGYEVANACIDMGAHYIDLADGRDFVTGIAELDAAAKQAGVSVISGASSVPCLTAALIDYYQQDFSEIHSVDYGITTAQKTTRGLATTAAILGYTGKPFTTLINGKQSFVYGWQSLRARKYHNLGSNYLLSNKFLCK